MPLRQTVRSLLKSRSLTLVALLTLTLGIGATTAIVSVVDTLLLRPLPYQDSERLVRVFADKASQQIERTGLAPADFHDFRREVTAFEHLGAYRYFGHSLGAERPRDTASILITAGLLGELATPLHGRTFLEEESVRGNHRVVIASHAFFLKEMGGDPSRVGQSMILDGESHQVVGVMGPDFAFPGAGIEIWGPWVLDDTTEDRNAHWWSSVAKLKPGVSLDQANAELERVAKGLEETYPASNEGWSAHAVPLHEQVLGPVRPALIALLVASLLVLLIACANVANLLLARGLGRQGELALRSSLGASRRNILALLLTESAVLAAVGGVLGVLLAQAAISVLVKFAPGNLPRMHEVALDARILLVALVMTVITAVVSGLLPALRLTGKQLQSAMKSAGRNASAGSGRSRVRAGLAVSQLALSVLLLIGAGLMLRSFLSLVNNDPGFESENRAAVQLFVYGEKYPEPETQRVFYSQLTETLAAIPGVVSVGGTSSLPMGQLGGGSRPVRVDGRAEPEDRQAGIRDSMPGYFETVGIPLLSGRIFNERDRADGEHVVVLNQRAADQYFPGEDPLGKRLFVGTNAIQESTNPVTVVGVVGDVRFNGMDREPIPQVYFPFEQSITGTQSVVVKTSVPPETLHRAFEEAVWSIDNTQAVWRTVNLDTLIRENTAGSRFYAWLISLFALTALSLAAIGLYGVISYSVAQRGREFGIRMAVGANASRILRDVCLESVRLIGIGLVIGLGLGLALTVVLTQTLSEFLIEVPPTDAVTFAGTAAVLILVGLLASLAPAWRASRVDPTRTLRS